jgi:hypothetical protein
MGSPKFPWTVASSFRLTHPSSRARGRAHAEITQAEGAIGLLRIDFRQQPRALRVRGEELHDRRWDQGVPANSTNLEFAGPIGLVMRAQKA